jgi:hypothetical protein
MTYADYKPTARRDRPRLLQSAFTDMGNIFEEQELAKLSDNL